MDGYDMNDVKDKVLEEGQEIHVQFLTFPYKEARWVAWSLTGIAVALGVLTIFTIIRG